MRPDPRGWWGALTHSGPLPPAPAELPSEVAGEIDLMPGESLEAWWPTRHGWLVATNLRVVPVWRLPTHLPWLDGDGWHVGPEFLYMELSTPRVIGRRFVELAEASADGVSARFEVADPATVVVRLGALREAGQLEWARRRSSPSGGGRPSPVPRPRVPCAYCGIPFDLNGAKCPTCGAPRPPA